MHLSDAEWKVMNVLWDDGAALSTRQVLHQLPDHTRWAYTTAKTILTRLADKGALDTQTPGNTVLYTPRITRRAARRAEVQAVLDRAFDGAAGPLLEFTATEWALPDSAQRRRLITLLTAGEPSSGA